MAKETQVKIYSTPTCMYCEMAKDFFDENKKLAEKYGDFFECGKKAPTVIKKDNSTEQREISVGLKGSNGNFEVLNGLEIGEKISLTQIK
jgi:glutaredoxin